MDYDLQHSIARLLAQAGSAHGVYEEQALGGVYDQNWPQWYAAYLIEHGLGALLKHSITLEQLSAWLKASDAAYRAEQPALSWPEYYAQRTDLLAP